jgi:hypothetical protein
MNSWEKYVGRDAGVVHREGLVHIVGHGNEGIGSQPVGDDDTTLLNTVQQK